MDSNADSSRLDTLRSELLITAAPPAAEDQCSAADTLEPRESSEHAESPQAEDTRTIPTRPVTPFTATRESPEFTEEEEDLTLSTDVVRIVSCHTD